MSRLNNTNNSNHHSSRQNGAMSNSMKPSNRQQLQLSPPSGNEHTVNDNNYRHSPPRRLNHTQYAEQQHQLAGVITNGGQTGGFVRGGVGRQSLPVSMRQNSAGGDVYNNMHYNGKGGSVRSGNPPPPLPNRNNKLFNNLGKV